MKMMMGHDDRDDTNENAEDHVITITHHKTKSKYLYIINTLIWKI